jgi:hypothetical protein
MVKIREDLKTTIDTHFLAKEKELTERMNAFESTQQNERHDDRNRTNNEHGAHNLHSNPGTYSTPVQSEHHETNNTPLEEEERKLPWNHTARIMRTSIQVMSNIHRFKREVIQHNLTADPRQDQLENFYNTLVTSLESYEMPIRRLTPSASGHHSSIRTYHRRIDTRHRHTGTLRQTPGSDPRGIHLSSSGP